MTVELVTIRNVELLEAGINWATSTGTFTFTTADLASAVDAAADPAVRTPVLKLGHVDPRFDGQFSIGRIENMHVSADRMTLLGDYVGVPRWLADIMATAFPRRSIEGLWNETSTTGNRWPFYLTACSLLGVAYPAIDTLEDIQGFFAGDPLDWVPAETEPVGSVAATADGAMLVHAVQPAGDPVPLFRRRQVAATVEVDDVRRAYYDSLTAEQAWWWIRAIQVDPAQLIVDDDDSSLYRVPYTASGSTVTFGDPVAVAVVYEDAPAVAAVAATAAAYATREQSRPITLARNDQEVPSVNDAAYKKLLGLEADASDADIDAAIAKLLASADGGAQDPAGNPEPATAPDAEPVADPARPATGDPAGTPVAPQPVQPATPAVPATDPVPVVDPPAGLNLPEGTVLVDRATLDSVAASAAKGAAAYEVQRTATRDRVLSDAVSAGKIPPSRIGHYGQMYDADPVGAAQVLATLPANLVPVSERGSNDAATVDASGAYPEEMLSPRQRAIRDGRAQPTYTEV